MTDAQNDQPQKAVEYCAEDGDRREYQWQNTQESGDTPDQYGCPHRLQGALHFGIPGGFLRFEEAEQNMHQEIDHQSDRHGQRNVAHGVDRDSAQLQKAQ